MRKTLIAFLLTGLTACSAPSKHCPQDKDVLNAGLYIFSGLESMIPERKDSVSIAKMQYEFAQAHYFGCDEPSHFNRHTDQAISTAFEYYNLSTEKRIKFLSKLKLIESQDKENI